MKHNTDQIITERLQGSDFTVLYGLRYTIGNRGSYFTITASNPCQERLNPEEIAAARPDLKQFTALHGSNYRGVPLHAIENGFYWLLGAAGREDLFTKTSCLDYLARHLRLSHEDANNIVNQARCLWLYDNLSDREVKTWFARIVRSQCPRWKQEADKAIKFLSLRS